MESRSIIIVNSYANTEEKISVFRDYLIQLKKTGYDIMLTSHLPLPKDILELVDYHIYDSENFLLPKEKSPITWFANDVDSINIYSCRHSYAIIKNVYIGVKLAKELGYENFIFSEYDIILSDSGADKITKIFDTLKNKKAFLFRLTNQPYNVNNTLYMTLFFAANIDFFLNNIQLVKSYNEWYTKEPYSSTTDLLEGIFVKMFKPFLNEIHLEDTLINDFFEKSKFDVNHIFDTKYSIVYNNDNPCNPIFFSISKGGYYSLYINNEPVFFNKFYNESEWIRHNFYIDETDTTVKFIHNNVIILDTKLNINNIVTYKDFAEVFTYNKKISVVIAAYFGHRNFMHKKYVEDKLFYMKKQLEYCNKVSKDIHKIYIPCTFDKSVDKQKILNELNSYDWNNQVIIYERDNTGGSYSSWHNALQLDNGDSNFVILLEDDYIIDNNKSISAMTSYWSKNHNLIYLSELWQDKEEWNEIYNIKLIPHARISVGMINNKLYHHLKIQKGLDFKLVNKTEEDFNLRFSSIIDNQIWFLDNYRLAGLKIIDWSNEYSSYFPHDDTDYGKIGGERILTPIVEKFID